MSNNDIEESDVLESNSKPQAPVAKASLTNTQEDSDKQLTYEQFHKIGFGDRVRKGLNKKYPEYVKRENDEKAAKLIEQRQEQQQEEPTFNPPEDEEGPDIVPIPTADEETETETEVETDENEEGSEIIPGQQEILTQSQADVMQKMERQDRNNWIAWQARQDVYTFHIQVPEPNTGKTIFKPIKKTFIEPTMGTIKQYRDSKAPAVDYEADAIAKASIAGYDVKRAVSDPEYKRLARLAEEAVYTWLQRGCQLFFGISETDFDLMKGTEIIANMIAVERRLGNPYQSLAKNLKHSSKTTGTKTKSAGIQ